MTDQRYPLLKQAYRPRLACRANGGMVSAVRSQQPATCPTCGSMVDPNGYVRSPFFDDTAYVPLQNQAAMMAAGTSQPGSTEKIHPVWLVMAVASVAGVFIELARYMDERKK